MNWHPRQFIASPRTLVLPLITSLILLIPTMLYWAHGRSVLAEFQQSRVAQYRLRLAKRIQTEVDSQLRPLRRLASEVSSGDVRSPQAFASSARSICREEPTLKYIAWIDRDWKCISASPPEAGPAIPGVLASGNGYLFSRLESSPNGVLLAAGDRLILLPIMMPDPAGRPMVGGAVVTCETTQAMLGALIPPDASAPFIVEVRDERGQVLFASDGATTPVAQNLLHSQEVDQIPVLDQSWSMSVAAAPAGLGQRPTGDTQAFLLSGVIVALLGGATVAQADRHRRRERQKNDEALQQQQRLNQQVRQDADAKATLLRELNHRVKNNLAGIVGLLSAGCPEMSEQAQQWLDRVIARIETLARAHELFVGTSSELGLADLIGKTLEPIRAIKPAQVQIKLDLAAVNDPLNTDQAVTLAMVVHELASNALQHGLGDRGTLCVRSSRPRPGWAMIEIIDDGTGVEDGDALADARALDASGTIATLPVRRARGGIGLQLVRGLVGRELHGTFSLRENASGGMIAIVEFPIAEQ